MVLLPALFLVVPSWAIQPSEGGVPVLPDNAVLAYPVGGLERTNASSEVVRVSGKPFDQAVRVTVRHRAAESNATQLTVQTTQPVRKGDVLLASVWLRGRAIDGKPARVEFLFEKSSSPWTKSVFRPLFAPRDGTSWKRHLVAFSAADDYGKGEAMASIRFATTVQQTELGDLQVFNLGHSRKLEDIEEMCLLENKLGKTTLTIDFTRTAQTMQGLGGNFCQPRYGSTEPLDVNGRYNLKNLKVAHARIGLPLNYWNPARGVYRNEAQAKASFLALQEMKRRGIPTAVSVWVGPEWMIGPDRNGAVLAPEMVDPCIDSITEYLKTARDAYGVEPESFSFNEPDYGVNFKFDPPQMIDFIRRAGAKFRKMGIRTKFLVADTANGANLKSFAKPLLEDKSIADCLGPISFHSWDALSAPDEVYTGIAELARAFKKPVWCLEAGHDPALWQKPNPWSSWDNAFNTALAYIKTVRLAEASLLDYWTYQNNYPIVEEETGKPRPVFHVIRQMQDVLDAGRTVVASSSDSEELQCVATVKGGSPAVLIANPIGPGTLTIEGFPPNKQISVFISDKTAQRRLAKTSRTDAKGRITVAVPMRSVMTVVGE